MLTEAMIRKAERRANRILKCTDCKVTGYSAYIRNGEVHVNLEICHDYEESAEIDMCVIYPEYDKRRVRFIACAWNEPVERRSYYEGYVNA